MWDLDPYRSKVSDQSYQIAISRHWRRYKMKDSAVKDKEVYNWCGWGLAPALPLASCSYTGLCWTAHYYCEQVASCFSLSSVCLGLITFVGKQFIEAQSISMFSAFLILYLHSMFFQFCIGTEGWVQIIWGCPTRSRIEENWSQALCSVHKQHSLLFSFLLFAQAELCIFLLQFRSGNELSWKSIPHENDGSNIHLAEKARVLLCTQIRLWPKAGWS